MEKPISDAVILMAGSGSRLAAGGHSTPKPLIQIGGRAVFSYLIDALRETGIRTVHVVIGRNSDALLPGLSKLMPQGVKLNPIHNPDWQKQNGLSVLAATQHVSSSFFLLMGDHLFEPSILRLLLREGKTTELNLAVDRKQVFDLDDAMKVQTNEGRVTAIGKNLTHYDAIDTGAFICPLVFFDYLERSKRDGDCGLADGVRAMAADGKVRAIDIGAAWWQDIDTPEMLAEAEKILSSSGRHFTRGPATP